MVHSFIYLYNREMVGLIQLFKDRLPLIIRGGMVLSTNLLVTTSWPFGIVVLRVAARTLKHHSTHSMYKTIVV